MISSKHFSKIAIILTSFALVLCILAMAFSDNLSVVVNNTGYELEYEDALFDTNNIIDINIIMDAQKWEEMLNTASQEVYYQCDVIINGTKFSEVGIRPKGNTSLSSIARDPDNNRYSFKLEFDQFANGQNCFGLDKLILNNSYADATNMKEALIYDMFQYLDADAPLYNYAKISVNDKYWGVYLALEAIEESFMLRNYGNRKGYLYKPDGMNFKNGNNNKKSAGNNFPAMPEGKFKMPVDEFKMPNGNSSSQAKNESENTEKTAKAQTPANATKSRMSFGSFNREADKGENRGRFGGFGGMGGGSNLNYTDDNTDSYQTIWNGQVTDSSKADHKRIVEALKNVHEQTNIEKYIDVNQILKYMAVHNFAVNDDSLSGSMAHNYYLYEADGQISILPWDYNLSLGGMHGGDEKSIINSPIDERWRGTQLFDFVLENEEYKTRYHEYYKKLTDEYLYGGEFEDTYNRIRSQIDSLAETDPNSMYTYEEYVKAAETFHEVIMLRAESVKGQLEGTIPSTLEEQQRNPQALVDASHIDLSDLGQFMMGGFGNRDNGNRQMPTFAPKPDTNTDK